CVHRQRVGNSSEFVAPYDDAAAPSAHHHRRRRVDGASGAARSIAGRGIVRGSGECTSKRPVGVFRRADRACDSRCVNRDWSWRPVLADRTTPLEMTSRLRKLTWGAVGLAAALVVITAVVRYGVRSRPDVPEPPVTLRGDSGPIVVAATGDVTVLRPFPA